MGRRSRERGDAVSSLGDGRFLVHALTPDTVRAWFAKHGAAMRYVDTGESEVTFVAASDAQEELRCDVTYEEGCPTCGGAYVKEWTMTTRTLADFNLSAPAAAKRQRKSRT